MENYLNFKNKIDYVKLKQVANIIKDGGIVVFPTDTVYGIGTNALNEEAVKKIFSIKKRSFQKPMSLLVSDIDMISKITDNISKIEKNLIETFMPGPLTIILKKNNMISDIVTAGKDNIGVRIPNNEIALKLIQYANCPIVASSANISGNKSGTNIGEIRKSIKHGIEVFIDSGESKIGLASTIVQVIDEKLHVLRKGSILEKEILQHMKF